MNSLSGAGESTHLELEEAARCFYRAVICATPGAMHLDVHALLKFLGAACEALYFQLSSEEKYLLNNMNYL